jgi:hypothetical protein
MADPNPPNYTNNGSTINNADKANDEQIDGKVIQSREGGLALFTINIINYNGNYIEKIIKSDQPN